MPEPSSPPPQQHLRLGDLEHVTLDFVVSPMPTAVEAVRDLVSDRPPAVLASSRRRSLRAALRPGQVDALAAFAPTPSPSDGGPNPVMDAVAGATMSDEIERLLATDPHALADAIERAGRSGRPTEPWLIVHRDAARWVRQYATALRLVWEEIRGRWMAAAGRLDREAERLHAAWTREAAGDVVRRVRTVGRVHDDALLLPSHTQRSGRLAVGSSLQLVPIVGTAPAGSWGDDYGDVIHALRYTLPAEAGSAPGAPRVAPDSLPALLGSAQAAVLRALERPMYAGPLAERLFLTPSGLSHHLGRLEAAGLVLRTRRGRRVLVRRTSRAVSLLLLYED